MKKYNVHDSSLAKKIISEALAEAIEKTPCASCVTSAFVTSLARWFNALIDRGMITGDFAQDSARALELIADHVRRGVRINPDDTVRAGLNVPPRKH